MPQKLALESAERRARPDAPDGSRKSPRGKPAATKKARLIGLLSARHGAKAPKLCEALGWQRHTVRAALSGLRKEGYAIDVTRSVRDGVTVYRITGLPGAVQ